MTTPIRHLAGPVDATGQTRCGACQQRWPCPTAMQNVRNELPRPFRPSAPPSPPK